MATLASISKTLTRAGAVGGKTGTTLQVYSLAPYSYALFSTSSASTIPQTSSTLNSQSQERKSGSRWLLFLPGAITFGLGTWQIFRREEKIKMLDYRQKRLDFKPLKFNDVSPSSEQLDSLEFRRVACKGVFDEKRSVFVGPRSRSISGVTENGYYIITPLMPIPNDPESVKSPILVNRGWVPRVWKLRSLEASHDGEQPSDAAYLSDQVSQTSWWRFWTKKQKEQVPSVTPVEVVGVVRGSENASIFVPENAPSTYQWFYVDVPAIAHTCGLPENTIYVEDINENVSSASPYPLPKDVNTLIRSSVMPQDHLNYTFTWYSLSAAVTFMAFKRVKPQQSRR